MTLGLGRVGSCPLLSLMPARKIQPTFICAGRPRARPMRPARRAVRANNRLDYKSRRHAGTVTVDVAEQRLVLRAEQQRTAHRVGEWTAFGADHAASTTRRFRHRGPVQVGPAPLEVTKPRPLVPKTKSRPGWRGRDSESRAPAATKGCHAPRQFFVLAAEESAERPSRSTSIPAQAGDSRAAYR